LFWARATTVEDAAAFIKLASLNARRASRDFAGPVNKPAVEGDRIVLTRRGVPVAAIVSLADLARLAINERISAARRRVEAEGGPLGRPRTMDDSRVRRALPMLAVLPSAPISAARLDRSHEQLHFECLRTHRGRDKSSPGVAVGRVQNAGAIRP
jgi:prevent-host-death family protein